jgi:hypothetical protein
MLGNRIWHGIKRSSMFDEEHAGKWLGVFADAKTAQWSKVLDFLAVPDDVIPNVDFLYMTEPDNPELNTLLHYAALTNANLKVVQQLVQMGAWRTRRNTSGKRPVDIARENGHERFYQLLEPELKSLVATDVLRLIEQHFHETIKQRAASLIEEQKLQLPQLEILLELENAALYFPIPGMYGGFNYSLKSDLSEPVLFTASECRVRGGSEQMHKITTAGSELVATGDDVAIAYLKETRHRE